MILFIGVMRIMPINGILWEKHERWSKIPFLFRLFTTTSQETCRNQWAAIVDFSANIFVLVLFCLILKILASRVLIHSLIWYTNRVHDSVCKLINLFNRKNKSEFYHKIKKAIPWFHWGICNKTIAQIAHCLITRTIVSPQ